MTAIEPGNVPLLDSAEVDAHRTEKRNVFQRGRSFLSGQKMHEANNRQFSRRQL